MIEIYVDGACSGNGNAENFGGFGLVAVKDDKSFYELKKGFRNTTNNEMELHGVLMGIKLAKVLLEKHRSEIIIYSDSAYCVNTINQWMGSWASNGWIKKSDKKPPENLAIIKEIYDLMQFERAIKVKKIAGHSGHIHNEKADKLAVQAKMEKEKEYLMSLDNH